MALAFRVATKSHGDQSPVTALNGPSHPAKSPNWRPALRRIKRGLFSSKEGPDSGRKETTGVIEQVPSNPPVRHLVNRIPPAPEGTYAQNTRDTAARGLDQKQPESGLKDRPRGQHDPKRFSFIKRSKSRQRGPAVQVSEASDPVRDSCLVAEGGTLEQLDPRNNVQAKASSSSRPGVLDLPGTARGLGKDTLAVQDSITKAPVKEGKVISVAPQYYSSTFRQIPKPGHEPKVEVKSGPSRRTIDYPASASKNTKTKTALQLNQEADQPKEGLGSSYIPKHAAVDFSRMNLAPNITHKDPLLVRFNDFKLKSFDSEELATIITVPYELMYGSSDYQEFLEASKRAATRTSISCWNKEAPKASRVLDEISANHHGSIKERAPSTVQLARARSVSRTRSIVEKVGEYIKPSRPESVYSQKTGFSRFGDGRSSINGSVVDGQEKRDKTWSRVGGSIRRSFSRDRDREGDERAGRTWASQNDGRGRSRIMPVASGLKRYNQTVHMDTSKLDR